MQDISVSHDFMNGTNGTMLFFPTASLAQAFSELENHTMCKLVGEFVAGRRRPFINAAGRTARIFRFQLGHFGTKFETKENLHPVSAPGCIVLVGANPPSNNRQHQDGHSEL